MFCDHFLLASERPSERALSFQLGGCEGREASFSLIRTGRAQLPAFTVTTAGGDRIRPRHGTADRVEFRVPADSRITLAW